MCDDDRNTIFVFRTHARFYMVYFTYINIFQQFDLKDFGSKLYAFSDVPSNNLDILQFSSIKQFFGKTHQHTSNHRELMRISSVLTGATKENEGLKYGTVYAALANKRNAFDRMIRSFDFQVFFFFCVYKQQPHTYVTVI